MLQSFDCNGNAGLKQNLLLICNRLPILWRKIIRIAVFKFSKKVDVKDMKYCLFILVVRTINALFIKRHELFAKKNQQGND